MLDKSITDIPEWIQIKFLYSLDFNSLLNARATCRLWNEILQPIIGYQSILNIRMDKSPASKKFRRGKWNSSLICPYQEIRIIPKPENAFWLGKTKSRQVSTLQNFCYVKKFTLFENGSLLHFIHRYMTELTTVRYIQIRERKFFDEETSKTSKYLSVGHALSFAVAKYKSWMRAMENLSRVETLRIRLFDRVATLIYMHLFTFRTTMLAHLELDFSKCYGLPFSRGQTNEIFCTLCDILEFCYLTLRQLRLKWAIRVDTDLDFIKSDDDIEPFFEFLLCLRNSVWTKLHLQQLTLTFPTINLALGLCETSFFPFLLNQKFTLKRVVLSRVLPNDGVDFFAARFPPPTLHKFEFHFYFSEGTLAPQPVAAIRGLEILLLENSNINFLSLATLHRGRRVAHHFTQLRLIHSHANPSYIKPNIDDLAECFRNIRILELLDTSMYGKLFVHFTSVDFNTIVRNMTKLVSLKMSNTAKFSDVGLTQIPEQKINYMQRTGVYYMPGMVAAPVAEAKELKYLDLRDLPNSVSDASVFFAFRHIKKLEKISFHGSHTITSWGKQLLKAKFKKNPYFDVIFKSYDDDYVTFGNYTMPCADFP